MRCSSRTGSAARSTQVTTRPTSTASPRSTTSTPSLARMAVAALVIARPQRAVRVAVVSPEGPAELGERADLVLGSTEAFAELLRKL